MTWPGPKLFSLLSTTQLSTGSLSTPSLWSHSKPSWDLSTCSWEKLNTGKVNAPRTCSPLLLFVVHQLLRGSLSAW